MAGLCAVGGAPQPRRVTFHREQDFYVLTFPNGLVVTTSIFWYWLFPLHRIASSSISDKNPGTKFSRNVNPTLLRSCSMRIASSVALAASVSAVPPPFFLPPFLLSDDDDVDMVSFRFFVPRLLARVLLAFLLFFFFLLATNPYRASTTPGARQH